MRAPAAASARVRERLAMRMEKPQPSFRTATELKAWFRRARAIARLRRPRPRVRLPDADRLGRRGRLSSQLLGSTYLKENEMNDEQIKHMVDRFLAWKLPENFRPDNGISFEPEFNVEYMASMGKPPMRHEPTGTNLLDYTQAEAMIRHMVEGMSGPPR
jgi:hypothetical protein